MAGYIGSKVAVVSSGAERKKVFTATSGQTSFTGLSYTVNNVHVFQNGVRLVDGTDYTATNGNSITLTVGAATDDQVVVVSYNTFQTSDTVSASAGGTFAGDVNFTGAFTSQGIDDNATSTAMTLDGSGNLLVGKTATGLSNQGAEFSSTGQVKGTAPNQVVGYFNRTSSDGSIVEFRKDNSTVGSIGANSSSIYALSGDTGILLYDFDDEILPVGTSAGTRDAAISLGRPTTRFKDLYLSGGVFLGGTGSANKLDDYEEGTWTPAYSGILAATYQTLSTQGRYVKIGRMVWATATITTSSLTQSGSTVLLTLPFTAAGNQANYSPPSFFFENGFNPAGGAGNIQGLTAISNNHISIYTISSSTGNNYTAVSYNDLAPSATTRVRYSVCYETTA